MHLTLSPQMGLPGQAEMRLHVAGDVLTLDDVALDLSAIPEGGEGWVEDGPILNPIRRVGGVLHVTVIARLGDTAAAQQTGPWVIAGAKGAIAIPALRKEISA